MDAHTYVHMYPSFLGMCGDVMLECRPSFLGMCGDVMLECRPSFLGMCGDVMLECRSVTFCMLRNSRCHVHMPGMPEGVIMREQRTTIARFHVGVSIRVVGVYDPILATMSACVHFKLKPSTEMHRYII